MHRFCVAVIVLAIVAPGRADVVYPLETVPFEFDPKKGQVEAIHHERFNLLLADLFGIVDAKNNPPIRRETLKRRDELASRAPRERRPDDVRILAGDFLRLGEPDKVLDLLPRNGEFSDYLQRAFAHLALGQTVQAQSALLDALDSDIPTAWPNTTAQQRVWQLRVLKSYLMPMLRNRSVAPTDRLDNLFGVDFATAFQVEGIAAEAKQALPADAPAIVQQLVLWLPSDNRLFWLLGELYNAQGELEVAARIFDQCADSRGYRPPLLAEHRRRIKEKLDARIAKERADFAAAEARNAVEIEEERQAQVQRLLRIACLVGAAVLLGGVWQVRSLLRRRRK